ncbi:MAG: M56 family metallopeptidase [Candidatus Dojkabacteria bacterium]
MKINGRAKQLSNFYFNGAVISLALVAVSFVYLILSRLSYFEAQLVNVCKTLGMSCQSMFGTHHIGITFPILVVIGVLLLTLFLILFSAVFYSLKTRRYLRKLLSKKIAYSFRDELKLILEEKGIENRINVVSDPEPFAFCYGYLRPQICISSSFLMLMNREEIEAVLLHESGHLSNRDPLKILILKSLSVGFFYIPLFRFLSEEFRIGRELAIDKDIISQQGTEVNIGSALLKSLRAGQQNGTPNTFLSVGMFETTGDRIGGIIDNEFIRKPRMPLFAALISTISIVLLVGLLSTGGVVATDKRAPSDIMQSGEQRVEAVLHDRVCANTFVSLN